MMKKDVHQTFHWLFFYHFLALGVINCSIRIHMVEKRFRSVQWFFCLSLFSLAFFHPKTNGTLLSTNMLVHVDHIWIIIIILKIHIAHVHHAQMSTLTSSSPSTSHQDVHPIALDFNLESNMSSISNNHTVAPTDDDDHHNHDDYDYDYFPYYHQHHHISHYIP